MASSVVRFTAVNLAALNKKGMMKKDSNGYYEICLGALNVFNSAGDYYTLSGAEELFKDQAILMRRIKSGNLKAEEGHPKRKPGESVDDFVSRALRIEETNVCAHIAEVRLVQGYGKSLGIPGLEKAVGIIGLVKPSGPMGPPLKESFDNPMEEVNFSIRSTTKDYVERGQNYKVLTSVITWDHITEPGIKIATKFNTLSTESIIGDSFDMPITQRSLERFIEERDLTGIGMEDSSELAREILKTFKGPVFQPSLNRKWK